MHELCSTVFWELLSALMTGVTSVRAIRFDDGNFHFFTRGKNGLPGCNNRVARWGRICDCGTTGGTQVALFCAGAAWREVGCNSAGRQRWYTILPIGLLLGLFPIMVYTIEVLIHGGAGAGCVAL